MTDINMPFLNGLELLKEINLMYPELITIALSGYDDFEKVKGVFTMGGLDYLLKPVVKEELAKVIEKACNQLEKKMTQNKMQLVEEKQQLKMKSYIQDSEYSAMLSSRIYGNVQNDVSNPQLFKEIGEISIMMVKFYEIEKIAKKHSHDIVKVSYVIKEKIKDILQKGENCVVFNYNSKVSEYFVILPAEYYSITSLARNLLNEFDIAEYGPVSIALYENCNFFNEIGNVYREMVTSLVTRPFSRCHFIIKCTNKNRMPEFTNIFSNEFEAELLYQLDKKQKSKVKEILYVKSGLHEAKTKNWSFIEMKQYIIQVRTILYNYVKRNIPEKLNETEDILENLEKASCIL